MSEEFAVARLASAWLLYYPDEELLAKLDLIAEVVQGLPAKMRVPLELFLNHLHDTPIRDIQQHYVGRSPNMWTLIGLGTAAAFVYSVVATIAPGIFPTSFVSMKARRLFRFATSRGRRQTAKSCRPFWNGCTAPASPRTPSPF